MKEIRIFDIPEDDDMPESVAAMVGFKNDGSVVDWKQIKKNKDMTDREIMHKLLDEILDSGNVLAIYTEFFPGIPGKIPAKQGTFLLEIKEASYTVTETEL